MRVIRVYVFFCLFFAPSGMGLRCCTAVIPNVHATLTDADHHRDVAEWLDTNFRYVVIATACACARHARCCSIVGFFIPPLPDSVILLSRMYVADTSAALQR